MEEWNKKDRWLLGFFTLVSGFILFFNLWSRSLENHGYLRYAEIAREMIRTGEWVVPHLNGEVFIDKPPMLFWLIAIPSTIYGSVTPFIARWPSALSAWIGIIILFLWGRKVYGTTKSGLIAGGILLSSYQYFFQSRLAKTDILLCLFILLSLYSFYLKYYESGRRRFLFNGLFFFFMGLGVLTKGPIGLLPLAIVYIFLIKERQWRILIDKELFLGYAILALTVFPWIFLFIQRIGLEQCVLLVKENKILTRQEPIYFYFIVVWGQFAPWSILLPSLSFCLWKERGKIWNSKVTYFIIWFIVLFSLLTLFKFRTSRYLLPALPPLAIMIGGMWRKKFVYFLALFLFTVSAWHVREYHWIKRDNFYSPGMVLVGELKPFLKKSALFGYGLDISTVEEINFYLDPIDPIPVLRSSEELSKQLGKREKGLFLMPAEAFEKTRTQGDAPMVFLQEFTYKKGKLVLVSN
ncbi:MAG: glycosyltransferase family 39 protein [Thermodesulfobacteriota bacterium]